MKIKLPEIEEGSRIGDSYCDYFGNICNYSLDDLKEFGRKCVVQERERCANIAEEFVWFEHEWIDSSDQNVAIANLIRKGD